MPITTWEVPVCRNYWVQLWHPLRTIQTCVSWNPSTMDRLRAVCMVSVSVSFIFSSPLKMTNIETPRFACRGWQRNHTHTRDRCAKQATRADHIRPGTREPKSPAKPRRDTGLLQDACGSSRGENQASRRLSEVDGGWKRGIEGKTSELWVIWVNVGAAWRMLLKGDGSEGYAGPL